MSKRLNYISSITTKSKLWTIEEACAHLKAVSQVKFTESVDVAIQLGIDTTKSDQAIRSSSLLPNGVGKKKKILVFTNDIITFDDPNVELASTDTIQSIKDGKIDFDLIVATHESMKILTSLAKILGPKGLMPNPKVGTLTDKIQDAVHEAKSKILYRNNKQGMIHAPVGLLSFDVKALKENLLTLIKDIKSVQPKTSKGVYLRSVHLSSTMGPGLKIQIQEFINI